MKPTHCLTLYSFNKRSVWLTEWMITTIWVRRVRQILFFLRICSIKLFFCEGYLLPNNRQSRLHFRVKEVLRYIYSALKTTLCSLAASVLVFIYIYMCEHVARSCSISALSPRRPPTPPRQLSPWHPVAMTPSGARGMHPATDICVALRFSAVFCFKLLHKRNTIIKARITMTAEQ